MNAPIPVNTRHLRPLSLLRLPFQIAEAAYVLSVVALTEVGVLQVPGAGVAGEKLPFGFSAAGLPVTAVADSSPTVESDHYFID